MLAIDERLDEDMLRLSEAVVINDELELLGVMLCWESSPGDGRGISYESSGRDCWGGVRDQRREDS